MIRLFKFNHEPPAGKISPGSTSNFSGNYGPHFHYWPSETNRFAKANDSGTWENFQLFHTLLYNAVDNFKLRKALRDLGILEFFYTFFRGDVINFKLLNQNFFSHYNYFCPKLMTY